MRIVSLLIPAVALAASSVQAQGARGAPLPTPTPISARPIPRPAVVLPIKLEDQWTTAVVQRDPRTFERLLAPNFIYTEDSSLMSRSVVIKSVTGDDHVSWARN